MKFIVTIPNIAKGFIQKFVRQNSAEVFKGDISDEIWLKNAVEIITMLGGLNPDLAQDFEVKELKLGKKKK